MTHDRDRACLGIALLYFRSPLNLFPVVCCVLEVMMPFVCPG